MNNQNDTIEEAAVAGLVLASFPALPMPLRPGQWTFENPLTIEQAHTYFDEGLRVVWQTKQIIGRLSSEGITATFTPFISEVQLIQVISAMVQANIIVLAGDLHILGDFQAIQVRVWNKCGKIIVEEDELSLILPSPGNFYRFWSKRNPRNPDSVDINESRPDAVTRYKTLVELMNEDMSIADIAHRLGVTRSAVYLMRNQYKEQLKIDVSRGMRAMQFRKRED